MSGIQRGLQLGIMLSLIKRLFMNITFTISSKEREFKFPLLLEHIFV